MSISDIFLKYIFYTAAILGMIYAVNTENIYLLILFVVFFVGIGVLCEW